MPVQAYILHLGCTGCTNAFTLSCSYFILAYETNVYQLLSGINDLSFYYNGLFHFGKTIFLF